jgi:prepilin-type N-terminal cleavage/methylation domain-containing protein
MLSPAAGRRGFTLVEILIALVIGLMVIGAAMTFAVNTVRSVTATGLREGVTRGSRFVAMSLERDFQATGVGIESTIAYGSVQVRGDTLVVLSIPFDTTMSPPYDLIPPPAATNPLPAGGTCGATCLDLMKAADSTFDIQPGDIARLQIGGERRLIHVQSMTESDTSVQLTFTNLPEILLHPASLSGGLLLDPFTTYVQKVGPVGYWVESGNLLRATRVKSDGSLDGDIVAERIQAWEVKLIFQDGDELDNADPSDGDATNDFDDILGVRINAVIAADRVNRHVNAGALYTRSYAWRFTPRNLMYERNRR